MLNEKSLVLKAFTEIIIGPFGEGLGGLLGITRRNGGDFEQVHSEVDRILNEGVTGLYKGRVVDDASPLVLRLVDATLLGLTSHPPDQLPFAISREAGVIHALLDERLLTNGTSHVLNRFLTGEQNKALNDFVSFIRKDSLV